jgi:hypothetical protein
MKQRVALNPAFFGGANSIPVHRTLARPSPINPKDKQYE